MRGLSHHYFLSVDNVDTSFGLLHFHSLQGVGAFVAGLNRGGADVLDGIAVDGHSGLAQTAHLIGGTHGVGGRGSSTVKAGVLVKAVTLPFFTMAQSST